MPMVEVGDSYIKIMSIKLEPKKRKNQMKNKIGLAVILSFLFLFETQAQQNALYKWQKGVVKDEFIYDKAAFPSCHSASIAETTAGSLVYTFFGGTREGNPDVEIYICRYENGAWTPPT